MDAKKHPALFATLGVLGVASLAGVVFAGIEYAAFSKTSSKLASADRSAEALLTKEPVALTAENAKSAKANLDALKLAETAHREDLAGTSPAARFENPNAGARTPDAGELGSIIKESVERWRAACHEAGVKLTAQKPEEFAFGFSRYFRTGVNPQKSLPEINRQTRIVDYIVKSLLAAKLDEEGVRLVAVDREPVELPAGTRNFNKDEISGVTDRVFRRDGLLRSEFFRLRFVGRSGVLRRLVNTVTDSGRALAVRGVEITPAAPELFIDPVAPAAPGEAPAAVLPAGLFGDTPAVVDPSAAGVDSAATTAAAPAPAKPEVVVPDAASDITVTFEFIEPVKAEVAAPAETAAAN